MTGFSLVVCFRKRPNVLSRARVADREWHQGDQEIEDRSDAGSEGLGDL